MLKFPLNFADVCNQILRYIRSTIVAVLIFLATANPITNYRTCICIRTEFSCLSVPRQNFYIFRIKIYRYSNVPCSEPNLCCNILPIIQSIKNYRRMKQVLLVLTFPWNSADVCTNITNKIHLDSLHHCEFVNFIGHTQSNQLLHLHFRDK